MHDPAVRLPPEPAPVVSPERDGVRHLVGVFGVGLVGSVLAMGEVWSHPSRRLVGNWQAPEVLANHWIAASIADALRHLASPFTLASGYAPVGDTVLGAAGGAAPLVSAPFLLALGWPLGLNVYLALVSAANVCAGAFLARTIGASRATALLGGLGIALSPYVLTEVSAGRLSQVPIWALLTALAFWIQALERADSRRAILAGGLVGVATLQYAWYGVLAGLGGGVMALAALVADRARWADPPWRRAVGLGVLVGLFASLPGAGLVAFGMPGSAAPVVPAPLSLEYSLTPGWPLGIAGGPRVPAAVSWLLAAVALVALYRERRSPASWHLRGLAAMAGVGWVVSMGPRLVTSAGPIADSHFPFFVLFSTVLPGYVYPYQSVLLVTVALVAIAARGLADLAGPRGPAVERAVVAAVMLAVPMEIHARGIALQPRYSELVPTPGWVAEITALPAGAILGLPLAPELRSSQEPLVLQLLDGHPIVDGPSAWRDDLRPATWDAWVAGSGFLSELERFERGREVPGDATRANFFRYPVDSVAALTARDVRWVMVWDAAYADSIKGLARAERRLLEALLGKPTVSSDGVAVYDLANHRATGELPAPLWRMPSDVHLGDGMHPLEGHEPTGTLLIAP
jgi:hypothetical protein